MLIFWVKHRQNPKPRGKWLFYIWIIKKILNLKTNLDKEDEERMRQTFFHLPQIPSDRGIEFHQLRWQRFFQICIITWETELGFIYILNCRVIRDSYDYYFIIIIRGSQTKVSRMENSASSSRPAPVNGDLGFIQSASAAGDADRVC